MSFRSDLHRALEEVTPPAPHLRYTVMEAVRAGQRARRPRALPRAAAVLAVVVSLALLGGGVVVFTAAGRSPAPGGSGSAAPARLVVTTWTPDASVDDAPYPGYRPEVTPLTSDMITNAQAVRNPDGDVAVQVRFDSQGSEIFRNVTAQAAAACPHQDCPQRHVTMWLDLTQDDVNRWHERAHDLYRPFSHGGKLLTDPVVTSPISGGSAQIAGDFNQQQADELARRLEPGG